MRFSLYGILGSGFSLLVFNACSAEHSEYGAENWDRDASVRVENDDQLPFADEESPACFSDQAELEVAAEPADEEPVAPEVTPSCPDDMVLVEGDHCEKVVQQCLEYIEDPRVNPHARCKVFADPTACKGQRLPMRFCVDRLEAAGDDGLPLADRSWTEAKQSCEAEGKRLCQEREWVFACEGEEARPYPYGFVRSPQLCNFEKTEGLVTLKGDLADHRQPVTANPECVSPFGVQNMVGNIDEWVVLDVPHFSSKGTGKKMNSGLKGGWWGPLRNRCRPTTVDHDEFFHELQTGFRCCKNAE